METTQELQRKVRGLEDEIQRMKVQKKHDRPVMFFIFIMGLVVGFGMGFSLG